jgi:hypothetical protein
MTIDNTTPHGDTTKPQRPAARWAEVVLIVLVFFAIAGDPAPAVNEPHYLGKLKHSWNPDWCAGDLFLDSPDAHAVFVWSFGWVTKCLSLAATAWTGRLLAWLLLAWAWQRLSWRIIPAPLISVLAAALWVTLTDWMHLAGEWVVGGVEAKCFAYVFVLVALRALVDGWWNRVWIALGAASAFHVLVGGWSVVICAAIWLKKGGTSISAMLPGLAIGALVALAGVVPALELTWNQPPALVAEANRIYVFERLPHHLSPLTLPAEDLVIRMMRHATLIAALWWLARTSRGVASTGALQTITWFAWGAVALAAIGLTIEIALWTKPLTAAALLRFYWFRLTDVAVPLAVAFQAASLIVVGFRTDKPWALWALAAAIATAAGHIGINTAERWANPVPPADARVANYTAWVDVCDWIAANTPPQSLFLTPRLSQSFKWRTGRPEVATRKDIPQDARSMVEWFGRLRKMYYPDADVDAEPLDSVAALGTDRAVELAREYGANYILTDSNHPLALPAVYPTQEHPNEEYVIYPVPAESDRDGS